MTAKRVGAPKPRTQPRRMTAKAVLDLDRLNLLWKKHQQEEIAKREQELNALPEGYTDERQALMVEIARLRKDIES